MNNPGRPGAGGPATPRVRRRHICSVIPDIGHAVCARSDKYAMCVARATCGALWSLVGLGESFVRSFGWAHNEVVWAHNEVVMHASILQTS